MPPFARPIALALVLLAQAAIAQRTTVSFRPLDEVEPKYLYRSLGSQEIPSERTRFQDGGSFVIYRFAFRKGTAAALDLDVTAQYQVDLSGDNRNYTTVATYKGSPARPLHLDLTPYTALDGLVYVRVGDAKPDDGWGGKVHLVSVTGELVDRPIERTANVSPTFLPDRPSLYERLPQPAKRLYHFPADKATTEETILFRTLQGLVNRDRNELLVGDRWAIIPELRRLHWATGVTRIPNAEALFRRYPKRDAVVYDPGLYGSENLAVMIGSMEGLVVAHPSLVGKYHLRVREDLRGRWKTTLDGYKAVYARYKPRFSRRTLVMAAPSKRPGLYDYAMAHRTFTFWIVGGTDAANQGADLWGEEEWFEQVLSRDFPVNIPILGYPQVEPSDGIGENRGVALFSRCAKFLVPADHMTNMSLLSAYPSARGKLRRPLPARLTLDRGKVYASMVLSDGDNLCLWNGPEAFMDGYMKQMRSAGPRRFSVAYTMGPSIVDLNPLAALLSNDLLEPQDTVGCAVSGVGYMYMSHYANNFGKDRERVVRDFTALTSTYMGYAGERWGWIMDYGGPGSNRLRDYSLLEGCKALMGGYGQATTDPASTVELVGRTPVFHSVTRMASPEDTYADARRIIDTGKRPLFLHIFIGNWGVNAAQYREMADKLIADGVEVVAPETLAGLYLQSLPAGGKP